MPGMTRARVWTSYDTGPWNLVMRIRAIIRAKSVMSDEQKERFKFAVRHLTEEKKKAFDTGRIEDVAGLV